MGHESSILVSNRCLKKKKSQEYALLPYMEVASPICTVDETPQCICEGWSTEYEVR